MTYQYRYVTPAGFSDLRMNSDGERLTGLWFEGSKDTAKHQTAGPEKSLPVFAETVKWLDVYFSGGIPDFIPEFKMNNLTPFRREVIDLMLRIPYGKTVTYGEVAAELALRHGIPRMSSRAVGGAVGWNPICLIIPCHRVIGANRALTGYGGGLENKKALLRLEGNEMGSFILPK